MTGVSDTSSASLFDRIGGEARVAAIVDRFYDLIEHEPGYAELRAMHRPDLFPSRVSLAEFLCGWLGGPRAWFDARPGTCVMSVHRGMAVTPQTARQWLHAMSRAMAENRVDPVLGQQMQQAFAHMAHAMLAPAEH